MKHFILTITFTLVVVQTTSAQEYQTINANRISYFGNEYQQVRCIRIDSTSYMSDSIFYPFTVMQEVNPGCFSPLVASWTGPRIIVKQNGMNLFFNRDNDSIKLKTRAHLNEKWIAFYFQDSTFIEATIIKHDTMNFLGLNDSVKTIGFQIYDTAFNSIDHEINNMSVQISKNHGLIKTLNFFMFPDYIAYYPPDQLTEHELIGLSNPEAGIQNITWYDVNDFQPGDELHIVSESSSMYGPGTEYSVTDKAIYKYLNREDFVDSIVYNYSRRETIYTVWHDSNSLLFFNDTLRSVIKPNPDFDKLPGEPVVTEYEAFSYNITENSKTVPHEVDIFFFNGDSCWFMPVIDGCSRYETYLRGLGGPYYSCHNALSYGWMERKLVYYRKGETSWGTPLVVSKISTSDLPGQISVVPNPAVNFVTVRQKSAFLRKLEFTLFDLKGNIVIHENIEGHEKIINLGKATPGIYFLRVTEKDSIIHYGKLVIR